MHGRGVTFCLVLSFFRARALSRTPASSSLPPLYPESSTGLSAFLLNFISALSAATRYLSRARMTGPLSSADRANLITSQRGMEAGGREGEREKEKAGAEREQLLHTVDSRLTCQYQI